jgi:hypothetical protein
MQSGKNIVRALIDSKQSVDSTDNNGNTALILGLKLNFSHFISYFIL